MTDDSLAKRIAEVGGHVVIGVREPNAPLAFDEAARTPVSPATLEAAKTWMRAQGVKITREYKFLPAVEATINPNQVAALRANPRIEYVEPNGPNHLTAQDTGYNVFKVGAPAAWASSTGSGVKVLVVGTGAQTNSDLSWANIAGGSDYPDCSANNGVDSVTTGLDAGHETAVAGVIAALDNSMGSIGIAPGVSIRSYKAPTPGDVPCAIYYDAMQNGVFAINMSYESDTSTFETDAIYSAYSAGILLVASAGNDSASSVSYPASLPYVMAVGATDAADHKASYSNYGTGLELVAPGSYIMTTCTGNTICQMSGTSFSAPAVTAAAAILKSYNPSWSNLDIRARLDSSAVDIGSVTDFGNGLLNIDSAMAYVFPVAPTISIDGPTLIKPGASCIWIAEASGGTTPYSYDWHIDNTDMGSDQELDASKPVGLGSPFTLHLDVRTADHAESSTSISVTESSSAPICPS